MSGLGTVNSLPVKGECGAAARGLAPRLRFLEFRDAADWKTEMLGTQGAFLSPLTGKTAKDFDTGGAAFIPYMNVFSNVFTNTSDLRSVSVESYESQNSVAKGDVFFTVSSETPEEAGMSSVLLSEIENCYLNSFCALFRFDDGKLPNPVFLGYLLRSALVRAHLSRGAQGATRYNISKIIFQSLPLHLPSGSEQQKIADCLGSLDDLIAAQDRKLEALRQYKQGLMQQLFPRPGETVPRMRFPGFARDSGWDYVTVADLVDTVIPPKKLPSSTYRPDGRFPIIDQSQSYICGWTNDDEAIITRPLPVIVFGDHTCVLKFVDQPFAQGADGIKIVIANRCVSTPYLYHWLSHRPLATKQYKRHFSTLKSEIVYFPESKSGEQQKIVDCLSSLDDLIAAQNRKLDALRQLKQGLLQQLFPNTSKETCHD